MSKANDYVSDRVFNGKRVLSKAEVNRLKAKYFLWPPPDCESTEEIIQATNKMLGSAMRRLADK